MRYEKRLQKEASLSALDRNSDDLEPAAKNQNLVRRFTWEIASINVHLQELRYFGAKALGISGPQWMILMALADLDQGEGVPVKVVSKMLHVDRSFATTQADILEKQGSTADTPP